MDWLIQSIASNPFGSISILIAAIGAAVAGGSLRTARQSIKTAKQSLETAQKALAATHLPNVGLELRFEPHEAQAHKHLQFFFRNIGSVNAIDIGGGGHRYSRWEGGVARDRE